MAKSRKFALHDGLPIPEPKRGRPKYDEKALVERAVNELIAGKHKSRRAAALAIAPYAATYSGGEETKVDRLQRKISKLWRETKAQTMAV